MPISIQCFIHEKGGHNNNKITIYLCAQFLKYYGFPLIFVNVKKIPVNSLTEK